MPPGVARLAPMLAVALAVAASAVAAHVASAVVGPSHWGVALAIVPFAAVAGAFCWQSAHRAPMLALFALGIGGVLALWPLLAREVEWLYLAQHVAINGLLTLVFGSTLRGARDPLCTRVARLIHGELDAAARRYTRGVTLAWTLFFALMAGVSLLLFAFAPIAVWSVFANLLTWPLVGAMFVAEYGVRMVLLPQDRSSILDAIRAYRKAGSSPPARRSAAVIEQ